MRMNILIFILGSIVGSFLNVCIWRMPRGESIITPWSHCIHCNKALPWFCNIPFLSYIILKGRCKFCKNPISFIYFIVEFITGASFVYTYLHFGTSPEFFIYTLFICGLIVVTFIDIKHRIIPDELSIGGAAAGILLSIICPSIQMTMSFKIALVKSFAGALVGGGIIYLTGLVGDFIFKKESMGGGDVKLMAMIGSFLGVKYALLTFFLAPLFGAIVGIFVKLKYKSSYIPYGPFLSLGAVISIFFGERILDLFLL